MSTPTDHTRPFAYRFVVAVLRPLLMLLTRRQWSGAENVPTEGGFVVVTNHYSHLDPFVLGHFFVDHGFSPRYLGKIEVFRIPVAGWIVSKADQIPVHRESDKAVHAYRSAVEAVQAGKVVVIYPEGTLTRDPELWPMRGKTGAARVALETGCPVVPVVTWGAQEILRPYTRWPHLLPRKTMHVHAGPPVALNDLQGREASAEVLHEATARIMADLVSDLEAVRGERAPGIRFDPRAQGVTPIGKPRPLKEAS